MKNCNAIVLQRICTRKCKETRTDLAGAGGKMSPGKQCPFWGALEG